MSHKTAKRNSSIELLRIIAMLMILAHHFIYFNQSYIMSYPADTKRLFCQFFLESFGKVGVALFFTITAWYFVDKEQSLKRCLQRVWLLERELLFWSLGLLSTCLLLNRSTLTPTLAVRSILPLTTQLWWYTTAYAIFLVLLPFLHVGLQRMGRVLHLGLTAVLLVIFGILSMFPYTFKAEKVIGFIYLYILIAAYKWYFKPLQTRTLQILLLIGLACIVPFIALATYPPFNHIDISMYATGEWKLPTIIIAFSLFLLFERISFHSSVINKIAKSTLAVYLITEYPAMRDLLWNNYFNINKIYHHHYAIIYIIGSIILIYSICTLADFIRQAIFAFTVDRSPARWYYLLWNRFTKMNLVNKVHKIIENQTSNKPNYL